MNPVRTTDPITSVIAATTARHRTPTRLAVYRALANHGQPMTADEIETAVNMAGYHCTGQRVRTVLAEEISHRHRTRHHITTPPAWQPVPGQTGASVNGNPARLWELKEEV